MSNSHYFQSDKPFIKKIFITNPELKFELSPEEFLEFPKPIYSLADPGNEWNRTLDDHIQIDFKMIPTIIDPSLYCQFEDDQLVGINGRYVDDFLRVGMNEWQTHSEATLKQFETYENQEAPLTFAGMYIIDSENMYHIDQYFYMSEIKQIPSDAKFSKSASMRMKLAWLAKARPDILLEISQNAQIIQAIYDKDITRHCKCLNKVIKYVHDHKASIRIPKLDLN